MRVGRVLFGDTVEPAVHHRGSWVRADACGSAKGAGVVELLDRGPALQDDLERLDLELLLGNGEAVVEGFAQLRQPLEGPRAIIAVGLNYDEHASEVSWEAPSTPLLFAKWPSALSGPFDPIPLDAAISANVDYEVELAAVIGRTTLDVTVEDALGHVSGYAVANDISARDIQFSESQWTRSKSFDGFCPLGPWITTADEVPDPQDLQLSCWVNDERRQHASTAQMVHGVAELVAFASRATTLRAGDVVLTGTPSGVAMASQDPRWLEPGDILRTAVEGLGELRNPLVARASGR